MTILVTNVATTDTFGTWLIKTNTLATIVSQNVVTVDSTANGSISTGSGYVNGYFGANTLIAYTGISGGSLIAGNTLNLLTNTSFVYSGTGLVNFTANSTTSNVSIVSNAVNIIPTSNTTLGGNNLNINAITTNATSNSFNINSNNTTIIGNTAFKANSTFAVLTINGNTLLANTTNTAIVGNTTFANSVLINGLANVNQLNISGAVTSNIAGNLRIEGNISIGGNLAFAGVATLSSNVAIAGRVLLNSISHQFANSYTFTNSSAAANIDIFSISTYRSHEYIVQLTDSTITPNPYYHVTKISILFDGSTAYLTEYGTLFNTTSLGTFDVIIGGGNIGLQLTPTTANVVAKFIRTSIVP